VGGLMLPYYTTAEKTINHPLNLPWGEVRKMDRKQFDAWWKKVCKLLATNFYEHGIPPKAGMSELELLKQFRTLCSIDIKEQIGKDENDGGIVYKNSIRLPVADHFFPNIFEAKDKIGKEWISVIDQVTDYKVAVDKMWNVIRNDAMHMYGKTVPETGRIEDHLKENKEEYGFIFYKPAKITKSLHKKFRIKISALKDLIKRRIVGADCIKDLGKTSDGSIVYLLQYKKSMKVFPAAFTLLKVAKVSAPTNFPTAVARAIYSRYAIPKKAGDEVIIWDPSMGFAGRLLGALSLLDRPIYYIGTDPNSLNYFTEANTSRYELLEKTFKNEIRERRDTFRGTYLKLGSEEATKSAEFCALKGEVDLAFTSPPYFSAELYSEDETQSSLKFDNYHKWRSGFLAATLQIAAEWVRIGGYVIWNVANSGGYPLEEDTRLICRQLGLKHIATEKMIIAAGAGSKKSASGTLRTWNFATVAAKIRKYEPVYVFRKIKEVPKVEKFAFSKLHKMSQ
jgi:hypothetical protein